MPVKDIAWLQMGQTSPILPSFMLERASSGDSARAAIHVLHARRAFICSSVASLSHTQNGAVSPLEVAAVGVVPLSGFRSRSAAVEVHRVHHVSDVWMLYGARHGGHFTVRIASLRNSLIKSISPKCGRVGFSLMPRTGSSPPGMERDFGHAHVLSCQSRSEADGDTHHGEQPEFRVPACSMNTRPVVPPGSGRARSVGEHVGG